MASVNKVILIGNLGRDPEVRPNENTNKIRVSFSLATSENYTDREGNRVTNTEWHNIVLWSPIAEIAEKFLKKGRQVYIEGKISNRSYQDREGATRNITEIIGRNLVLLGGRTDDNSQTKPMPLPTTNQSGLPESNNVKVDNAASDDLDSDQLPF